MKSIGAENRDKNTGGKEGEEKRNDNKKPNRKRGKSQ
jgi:hypothetical protein